MAHGQMTPCNEPLTQLEWGSESCLGGSEGRRGIDPVSQGAVNSRHGRVEREVRGQEVAILISEPETHVSVR